MLIRKKEIIFNVDASTGLPTGFSNVVTSGPITEEFLLLTDTLIAEFIQPFWKEKTLLKACATIIPSSK